MASYDGCRPCSVGHCRPNPPFEPKMNGGWDWVKKNWWQLLIIVFVAGGVAWQVRANSKEIEWRRPLVAKIPELEKAVIEIRDGQRKILCRLGDEMACERQRR